VLPRLVEEGEYFEGDAIVYENEYDVITGVRG
jgi:dihydroxy-acid dehydratase